MKLKRFYSFIFLCVCLFTTSLVEARPAKRAPRPLPLTSVHIVDRNGFTETINSKDRLKQFQSMNFLESQPYQKVLRIYARDSKGNIRSVVTTYHPNGNPKQFLEILNARANGKYREWHENGVMGVSAKVIGGNPDVTPQAERSWLFDGISQAWDEDGHLLADISYSQGLLEGISTYYHTNRQVWKRIPYKRNQVDGTVEIFKESGEILQQMTYHQGIKQGIARRYWDAQHLASQEEYVQDKLENGQYFDQQGHLIAQVQQGNGYRAIFSKDGIRELQEYQGGAIEGEVKVFNDAGLLRRLYHVRNEIKHGEETEYYINSSTENPQPCISFNWYEGKVQGPVKTWYSNGNLESQKEMANNEKNGLSTVWYKDGSLMMIEHYEQDKLMRGEYFKKGEKSPCSQVIQGNGTATIFDGEGHFTQKVAYLNGKPDMTEHDR